jgi:hypothetical protein
MIKRLFLSSTALLVSMLIATPSFAYVLAPNSIERVSRRQVSDNANVANNLRLGLTPSSRQRMTSEQPSSGRSLLQRSQARKFRRLNRTRKPGSDRYRTLNLRENPRSIRRQANEAMLPSSLVQTGGDTASVRPTRRSIMGK